MTSSGSGCLQSPIINGFCTVQFKSSSLLGRAHLQLTIVFLFVQENTGEVFVPRIIVANKIDLRDGPSNSMKPSELRFVATPEGDNLAKVGLFNTFMKRRQLDVCHLTQITTLSLLLQLYKAEFLETSVLNYLNVDETIVNLARWGLVRLDTTLVWLNCVSQMWRRFKVLYLPP